MEVTYFHFYIQCTNIVSGNEFFHVVSLSDHSIQSRNYKWQLCSTELDRTLYRKFVHVDMKKCGFAW